MKQDIDFLLREWAYKPGVAQARMLEVGADRQIIQLRIDLGVLQMETSGRPDGALPHGHATYLDFLQEEARLTRKRGEMFVMNDEQCMEADREFLQFYHRRMSWLALKQYPRAIRDADHTLAFMDFVKRHSPSDDYLQAHEQYRGLVFFQRTQAAAAWQVENNAPAAAIDEIHTGLNKMRQFFAAYDREDAMDEDGMVQHLRYIESALRKQFEIGPTLREQLQEAIDAEDYERAARLRDKLQRRDD